MNTFLSLIFVAASFGCVYAAVGIYPAEPKPPAFANQQGCYLSKFNAVLPFNKPYNPEDDTTCEQYTCGTSGETQVVSCGVLSYPDDCSLVVDLTQDYPKCCGDVVCPPTTESPATDAPVEPEAIEGNC